MGESVGLLPTARPAATATPRTAPTTTRPAPTTAPPTTPPALALPAGDAPALPAGLPSAAVARMVDGDTVDVMFDGQAVFLDADPAKAGSGAAGCESAGGSCFTSARHWDWCETTEPLLARMLFVTYAGVSWPWTWFGG
jgi:endonuclease YncB( thermonuclease family)